MEGKQMGVVDKEWMHFKEAITGCSRNESKVRRLGKGEEKVVNGGMRIGPK